MDQKALKRAAWYLGVAASIAVPALVIAQQQRNPPADGTFAAQTLLRAGDVEQLRDALADAIARINALEANAGVVLDKANMYEVSGDSGPISQNANALGEARCQDENDILTGCSCEGRFNETNQLSFELRRVAASNRANGVSFCSCQGVNVGSEGRSLRATAQCLTVP